MSNLCFIMIWFLCWLCYDGNIFAKMIEILGHVYETVFSISLTTHTLSIYVESYQCLIFYLGFDFICYQVLVLCVLSFGLIYSRYSVLYINHNFVFYDSSFDPICYVFTILYDTGFDLIWISIWSYMFWGFCLICSRLCTLYDFEL